MAYTEMKMKHILQVENGEVEFSTQEDILRYFMGESPELEKIGDNKYKATFTPTT